MIDKYVVCINLMKVSVCKIYYCLTENLALHQPAWQSSVRTASSPFKLLTADLAVDGSTPTCAVSNFERTAEWWVDLRGVKNIHHVLIQHIKGNRVWGIVSYKLIHSN